MPAFGHKQIWSPPGGLPRPVVDYLFKEGAGNPQSELDSRLPGYVATMNNMSWGGSGVIITGSAPAYCDIPDNDLLTALNCRFTVSVRWQPYTISRSFAYIVSKVNFGASQSEWYIRHTDGVIDLGVSSALLPGNWTLITSSGTLSSFTNCWLFFVGEGNGVFRFYVDTSLRAEELAGPTTMENGTADMVIGSPKDSASTRLTHAPGQFYRVRYDNVPLTAEQRQALMDQ